MVVGMQHQQQQPHASPATVLEDAITPCALSSPSVTPSTSPVDGAADRVGDARPSSLAASALSAMGGCPSSAASGSRRVKLRDVNRYLICGLCKGYFVDATSIAECLHSFCRSCIILHLGAKSYCPECHVQINNSKPHLSLKPDKTLQDIVYKLVPGLFHAEMKRRNQFYQDKPNRDTHMHPEFRGITVDRLVYSPQDSICLSLEYYDKSKEKQDWENIGAHRVSYNSADSDGDDETAKKHFQCPAAVRVVHLKKLISRKYGLDPKHKVELFHRPESLPDDYSLMDIAYIYAWKRNSPLKLHYRINILHSVMESFDKLTLTPVVEEKSSQLTEKLASSVNEAKWKEVEQKKANTKAPIPESKPPSLIVENGVKTSNERGAANVPAAEALSVNVGAAKATPKVNQTVNGPVSTPTTKSTAALPSSAVKCKLAPSAATAISNSCTTSSTTVSTAAVNSSSSLPKFKASHVDHRKPKTTKTPVPSLSPIVSSSTEKVQSSPIKSYLTISSILNEPEPKKVTTLKNASRKDREEEIKKSVSDSSAAVSSSADALKSPSNAIASGPATTTNSLSPKPTANSLSSIVKLLTTSATSTVKNAEKETPQGVQYSKPESTKSAMPTLTNAKCSKPDLIKPVVTSTTQLIGSKMSQAEPTKPIFTPAVTKSSASDQVKTVFAPTSQSIKCSTPDTLKLVSVSVTQPSKSVSDSVKCTVSTSNSVTVSCAKLDQPKPVVSATLAKSVSDPVKSTVSVSSTSVAANCAKPDQPKPVVSATQLIATDVEKNKVNIANKPNVFAAAATGTVVSITRSISSTTISTSTTTAAASTLKSNFVTSPAVVSTAKIQSSVPPPLITLTSASATITSTFVATKRPGTPSYILTNTKIPSSLEISVMQAKDKEPKPVSNSPVLSLQKMVQQNFTNGNHVVNGVSKTNHVEGGKQGMKRSFHDVADGEDGPSEKYPCLSISKTTSSPVSAAKEKKRSLQNEISVSTSDTVPAKKIFSPNIVPEVSITVNQNPERPKRISPETSYDVSCFKSTDKKEVSTNGVPPLTPIVSHSNPSSFAPKNIQNSPIKNLNKNFKSSTSVLARQPLLMKSRTKLATSNNVEVTASKQAHTAGDALKRSAGTDDGADGRITTNGTVAAEVQKSTSKTPNAKSADSKSNREGGPKKEGGGIGRHHGIPQLIDINTPRYTQLMASQNAKMRSLQPFNNYASNLYVKPPPLTPPANTDNALDLSSPSSKSPTGSSEKSESSPSPEKKKLIPSVPPLMIPVTMNKTESRLSPGAAAPVPKIERKVSPITKSDKKASSLCKQPESSKSSPVNRKTEFRLTTSSPSSKGMKMSPSTGDIRKSPSNALVPAALSSKGLTAGSIIPTFPMSSFPAVLQFYQMPQQMPMPPYDWLCNIKTPLPLHPNMHERGNPTTLQESLRNLKK